MDIRDILYRIRAQESDRAIQRATGVDPRTVKKYRAWAAAQGLLEGSLPSLVELERRLAQTMPNAPTPQQVSSVAPYREVVVQWRQAGVEIAAIHQRLRERGYGGSYMAVWRFVRQLEPRAPEATVRVERAPGEEAQVDFGSAGKMLDPETGKARPAWAFVMTLAWSRHQFVHFVFDQKLTTWLDCHQRAFAFFGGVPRRIVVDNLKAAITKACWDDPEVQQSYRECAEHYGFLIGPCRPNTPEHKGKVEQGGVHYVKRNFLGGRALTTITQANQDVRQWCETTAGERLHGTTKEKPRARFQAVERDRLQPLPAMPYDMGVWKLLKLHRDCYVTFDGAYYSAPFTYIGQRLRVRAGTRQVRLYTMDFQLVATHDRAEAPGTRRTHLDHLPPQKVPGLTLERDACRAEAAHIGVATAEVVQTLLDDPVIDRLPTVGRLLRLRQRFGAERLEAACRRARHFDDPAYRTVKRILMEHLDAEPLPGPPVPAPPAQAFVRSAIELVGARLGELAWT